LAPQRAFSLIEVVLAVGVVAFAFVAILGLLPAGMSQFRQAIDTSVCAQIAQRIINEAQQTDFNVLINEAGLPANAGDDFAFRAPTVALSDAATAVNPGKCVRYFDEQGNEVLPKASTSVLSAAEKRLATYQVNIRVTPRTSMPTGASYLPHLATLTIQVAYNPGNLPVTLSTVAGTSSDPTRKLWIKTDSTGKPINLGVPIISYCAQIARN